MSFIKDLLFIAILFLSTLNIYATDTLVVRNKKNDKIIKLPFHQVLGLKTTNDDFVCNLKSIRDSTIQFLGIGKNDTTDIYHVKRVKFSEVETIYYHSMNAQKFKFYKKIKVGAKISYGLLYAQIAASFILQQPNFLISAIGSVLLIKRITRYKKLQLKDKFEIVSNN